MAGAPGPRGGRRERTPSQRGGQVDHQGAPRGRRCPSPGRTAMAQDHADGENGGDGEDDQARGPQGRRGRGRLPTRTPWMARREDPGWHQTARTARRPEDRADREIGGDDEDDGRTARMASQRGRAVRSADRASGEDRPLASQTPEGRVTGPRPSPTTALRLSTRARRVGLDHGPPTTPPPPPFTSRHQRGGSPVTHHHPPPIGTRAGDQSAPWPAHDTTTTDGQPARTGNQARDRPGAGTARNGQDHPAPRGPRHQRGRSRGKTARAPRKRGRWERTTNQIDHRGAPHRRRGAIARKDGQGARTPWTVRSGDRVNGEHGRPASEDGEQDGAGGEDRADGQRAQDGREERWTARTATPSTSTATAKTRSEYGADADNGGRPAGEDDAAYGAPTISTERSHAVTGRRHPLRALSQSNAGGPRHRPASEGQAARRPAGEDAPCSAGPPPPPSGRAPSPAAYTPALLHQTREGRVTGHFLPSRIQTREGRVTGPSPTTPTRSTRPCKRQ